ncbi:hypothetical protein ACIP93_33150 [Streptomyces sp. NPDC088745]|uniref:hypothetical protein n=1 Tax=Streptomyces sp. NPDC088745 TaxID=3365884 RepID=UPI003817C544
MPFLVPSVPGGADQLLQDLARHIPGASAQGATLTLLRSLAQAQFDILEDGADPSSAAERARTLLEQLLGAK